MTTKKINVLFGTQEYFIQAGGVGPVTIGLAPALMKKDFNVSVVTPFFDAYNELYKNKDVEHISTITHLYKAKHFKSDIFRVRVEEINGEILYHYLIKPVKDSPVGWLFNIENDGTKIYQSFSWSEAHNRREYFNSAIAAMLRYPNSKIPEFDIYHAHTWHTGIAGVLAKEMDGLPKWQGIFNEFKRPLKKIPYMVSTVHMLLARENGQITDKKNVKEYLHSLGLPEDFAKSFTTWKNCINSSHLKQSVLTLLYSDHVTTVSEGLAHEAAHIKGGGQGLDHIFNWLDAEQRFTGILNGIDHVKFDPTKIQNLKEFTINPASITAGKYKIKTELHKKYPQLDPDKMWFTFIARFAEEKGMDMLSDALDAITKENGIFIILGRHIIQPTKINGKVVHRYGALIDELRNHPNVLIIDDPNEQKEVGAMLRAATDCITVLSHNEACGLPQIEGFANGAFAVAPQIQGLPDSVKDLTINTEIGTGFLYSDDIKTRHVNLKQAIAKAAKFYRERNATRTMDNYLQRLMEHSKQFDWNENPALKYKKLYDKVIKKPLLRLDQIRSIFKPMLSMLSTLRQNKRNVGPKPNKIKPATPASNNEAPKPHTNDNGKIFIIGFNKSGTQHMYFGFCANDISSIHYGRAGKSLASVMYDNFKHGRKLLTGVEQFKVYADFEDIYYPDRPIYPAVELFMQLDRQYPGSTFILNTRDKSKWIKSRLAHKDPISGLSYKSILCTRYQITESELVSRWNQEWDDHHAAVRAYFKDRPTSLLEYNIETGSPQDICDFYPELKMDPTKFKHLNKSKHTSSSNNATTSNSSTRGQN